MLKRNRFRNLNISLMLIFYTTFVFRYQVISILDGKLFPVLIFKQDSPLYLSQIQLGISDRSIYTNPFWGGAPEDSLVGRNFGLYLIGKIAGFAGFDLIFVFLLSVMIVSCLFAYSIYKLQLKFLDENRASLLIGITVAILAFGDFAFRPSPTQWALPLALLLLIATLDLYQSKSQFNIILGAVPIIVALAILNPFYAIYFAILIMCIVIVGFKRNIHRGLICLVLLSVAFFIGRYTRSNILENDNLELIERWGLLFSYFPGSIKSSSVLLLLLFINTISMKSVSKQGLVKFTSLMCFSLLITLQQNIITGVWWEPESHYYYFILVCALLTALNLIRGWPSYLGNFSKGKFSKVLQIMICFFILLGDSEIGHAFSASKYKKNIEQNRLTRDFAEVLVEDTIESDLIASPNDSRIEITWASLLADRRFVWDYQGSLLSGSDEEIILRFLCNYLRDFKTAAEIPNLEFTRGHRLVNASQHFSKWMFLANWIPQLEKYSYSELQSREAKIVDTQLPFLAEARCRQEIGLKVTKSLIMDRGKPTVVSIP